jgi:hypothetical protein
MSFPKVTTAYVPPVAMHRVLGAILEHMHYNVDALVKPVITEWQVLDDRGGTGAYRILFPELSTKQVQKLVGKDIQVTQEDE